MGSGGALVGRAVASDIRGPWFESSHQQKIIYVFTISCIEKMKRKIGREWPIFKKRLKKH